MSPAQDARDDVVPAGRQNRRTAAYLPRPMGRLLPNPEENDWTIRFVTDGRSGKVGDIRRAGKVGLIFQHDPDDAFVALTGRATLLQRDSEGPPAFEGRLRRLFSHRG